MRYVEGEGDPREPLDMFCLVRATRLPCRRYVITDLGRLEDRGRADGVHRDVADLAALLVGWVAASRPEVTITGTPLEFCHVFHH